jgi:hypothetical protein
MKPIKVWIARDEGTSLLYAYAERPRRLESGRKIFIGDFFTDRLKRRPPLVAVKEGCFLEFTLTPAREKGGKR